MTTPLIRSNFLGPLVVILTGLHCTGKFNAQGSSEMEKHPIQGGVEIHHSHLILETGISSDCMNHQRPNADFTLNTAIQTYSNLLLKTVDNVTNHKNYNFFDCDWYKKHLLSTNLLAKLLSDSLLLNSLLLDSLLLHSSKSQSHSKLQFKSTNHIQSCSLNQPISISERHYFSFLLNCNFYD